MDKPIRVKMLGREYALRVKREDEELTKEIARYLDLRMRAFREAHPEQHELTTAVITALAVTEELFTLKKEHQQLQDQVGEEFEALNHLLESALYAQRQPVENAKGNGVPQ